MAAGSGLTVRARHDESSLVTARAGVTAAGALLALAVLAMTVGTIRGEAAGELRTLTAAGATRAVRRGLTAVTAGVLALGGVLLGAAGAYLALLGAYAHRLHALAGPPYVELATALVGVPLLAAAAGWLLGGREPGTLARRLLE
jgi:putative ABC transport system permease protein